MARFGGVLVQGTAKPRFGGVPVEPADPKKAMSDRIAEKAHDLRANQAPIVDAVVRGLEAGGGISPEEEASGEWERGVILPIAKNTKTGERKAAVPASVMGVVDAFTLPHDVMEGEVAPMSDEGIARGIGFTTVFSPGAPKVGTKAPLPGSAVAVVPKETKALVPTSKELKVVAQGAYGAAKGSEIAATATPQIVDSLMTVLDKEGLVLPNGKLASTFSTVRTAMKDAAAYKGKPMTFEQFQRLEEALQGVAASKVPGEARIGSMLLEELDKAFAGLPDGAFTKGAANEVKAGYASGKAGWAQYSKLKRIEKAISNAELAKSGFAEGLKDEFRKILRNESRSRGFTNEELGMMRAFIDGGKIEAVQSWLGGLRGLSGTVAGGVTSGLVGAVGVPLLGSVAKGMQNARAKKTATQLRADIARGPTTTAPPLPRKKSTPSVVSAPLANAGTRALGAGSDSEAERGGLLRSALPYLRAEIAGQ